MIYLKSIILVITFLFVNNQQLQIFPYHRLKEFRINDKIIKSKKHTFYIDNRISNDSICFFSYQKEESEFLHYTVLEKRNERGFSIWYVIERNSLIISKELFASYGYEYPTLYETFTKYVSNNTFKRIKSRTDNYDVNDRRKLKKTIGDTIWEQVKVDTKGAFTIKELKRIKFR